MNAGIAVIPITMLFLYLRTDAGIINSALILALLTTAIALISLWSLNETFYKDLNYNEKEEGVTGGDERPSAV